MITSETIYEELTFEDIEPYLKSTGEGDTGLTSRLKLKRNFEKIRAVIAEICDEGIGGGSGTQIQVEGGVIYSSWERGHNYYAGSVNPDTGLMETSLVWHRKRLWLCLVNLTTEEPSFGCSDWRVIWGDTTLTMVFYNSAALEYPYGDYIQARKGSVSIPLYPRVFWGEEDITDHVTAWRWKRAAGTTVWDNWRTEQNVTIGNADMPTGWSLQNPAVFTCYATVPEADGGTIENNVTI